MSHYENDALQPQKNIWHIMKMMHSIHKEYLFVIMTMMNPTSKILIMKTQATIPEEEVEEMLTEYRLQILTC